MEDPTTANGDGASPRTVIRCVDLKKLYRMGEETVRALDGVTFKIHAGEMVAIVGQSGSGKSTLMNMLGCLDTPSSGKYILDDTDVSDLSDDQLAQVRNHKIGFIFQTFNLLARTSALENVGVPLFYRGASGREARDLSRAALTRVGLGDRVSHHPNQLSGGQRQRVAVARALVTEPSLLLADEPTGNLDSATTRDMMKLFAELHEHGATIIIVTHDEEIAQYCPRRIHLHDGKIARDFGGRDSEEPAHAGSGESN